jgi:hypothetical protein
MDNEPSPWPPPVATASVGRGGGQWSRACRVALIGSGIGWGLVGLFALMRLFSGEETNCTANRGGAYQDCVRSGDQTGLVVQAIAFGLAAMGCILLARDSARRSHDATAHSGWRIASAASSLLVLASVALWIWGLQGGWAPDRPFAYEPVPNSTANTIMVVGLLAGALVGGAWPLGSRSEDRSQVGA